MADIKMRRCGPFVEFTGSTEAGKCWLRTQTNTNDDGKLTVQREYADELRQMMEDDEVKVEY